MCSGGKEEDIATMMRAIERMFIALDKSVWTKAFTSRVVFARFKTWNLQANESTIIKLRANTLQLQSRPSDTTMDLDPPLAAAGLARRKVKEISVRILCQGEGLHDRAENHKGADYEIPLQVQRLDQDLCRGGRQNPWGSVGQCKCRSLCRRMLPVLPVGSPL